MKPIILLFGALALHAQTAPAPLPQYLAGMGPTWMRGNASPYNVDVNLALRLGATKFYSYTTISTPITTTAPGAQPVASSITTGGAWVPVQSPTGAVSLVMIAQAGFSAVQANSTIAPMASGSFGVAFRLAQNIYIMPFAKLANASTSATSGALATAVLQPGVQVLFSFGVSK